MSDLTGAQSATPFAFNLGQRVRCVTGERGQVMQRWLTATGPKYLLSTDDSGFSLLVLESDLTEITLSPPWATPPPPQ